LRIILNNTFEQKSSIRVDLYRTSNCRCRWFDIAPRAIQTRVIEDVNSVERVLIDGIEQGVVAGPANRDRDGGDDERKTALLALTPFPPSPVRSLIR
jgi:ATP-binding cassette subfamily B protein/subfamily B ATP-binding cassette protein MsbA